MRRSRTLVVLGIFVGMSPFFGLPYNVLMWLLPVVGLLIVIVGVGAMFEKSNKKNIDIDETELPLG